MADEFDKTEEPTAKKLEKTREEGQFARSQELSVALLTISVAVILYFIGSIISSNILSILEGVFIFDSGVIRNEELLPIKFSESFIDSVLSTSPIFLASIILSITSAFIVGGIGFSVKGFTPKLSKLDPLAGIKKIFGIRSLIEILKGIVKLILIGSILIGVIYFFKDKLLSLPLVDMLVAPSEGLNIVVLGFLLMSLSLLFIAAIDVPIQVFLFKNKLKMSVQEIRDEMKETEGNPLVKQRIRTKQREIAMSNMLEDIQKADVVITNPIHFAVALSYDVGGDKAPIVVGKGSDLIASRIKDIAQENGIYIFEEPVLARAIFYSSKIGEEIPNKLFEAVAEVIAFVFKINTYTGNKNRIFKPNISVPKDLVFDNQGKKINK
jgi:flagellar biosynthetic protein FlhB